MTVAIVVDLGATHIRAAVVNAGGQLLQCIRTDSRARYGPDAAMEQIQGITADLRRLFQDEAPVGLGVAVAGIVDEGGTRVVFAPNLPGWESVPLCDVLHRELGLPVILGNDCNFGALGEHRLGAGVGHSHMAYVAIGTGVGAGIIIDNRLLVGSHGLAGEFGHMSISLGGPACPCGCAGHLEGFVSGKSLMREYVRSTGHALAREDACIGWGGVFERARGGDPQAARIVREAGMRLGFGIASLVHLLNPQIIVIGGASIRAFDCLIDAARPVIDECLMRIFHNTFEIVPARLLDDSALVGAATEVFRTMGPARNEEGRVRREGAGGSP